MQKATSDYDEIKSDPVKLTELKKKTTERWLACLFIKNSDQTRHGSMIKKLREQKALKHDQCPETLNDATEAMNAHAIDAGHYDAVRKDKESRNKDSKSTTSKKEKVPSAMFAQLNFANIEGRCCCCGKAGHVSPNCRNKDKIPREKWATCHFALQISILSGEGVGEQA